MKSVQQESQDLGDPVKLLIEETFLRQLVVHLWTQLLDALRMSVSQVSSMLALEELNNLI